MTDKGRIAVAALSWVMWSCLAGSVVVVLPGCAANLAGANMNSDRVTESDESEVHKRARLRLELALAYFAVDRETGRAPGVRHVAEQPEFSGHG